MLAYTPTHRICTAVLALLFVVSLAGCSLFDDDKSSNTTEIAGIWQNGTAPDYTVMTVTDETLTVHAQATGLYGYTNEYSFRIVSGSDSSWNTDDAARFGDRGYLLLRYTSYSGYLDADSLLGRYIVLRWRDFDGSSFSYQEGWADPCPETAAAALQMSFTNGFNDIESWYTLMTRQ